MELRKIDKPVNFIIYGASGDLAQLKLFPSIYELALQKRFDKPFSIIGYARTEMTDDEFREHFKKSVKEHVDEKIYDEQVLNDLLKHVYYFSGQYDSDEDYSEFADRLLDIQNGETVLNLAYLAIPPSVFKPVIEKLAGIRKKLGGNLQVMIEKPFGEDRKSAGELFRFINEHFDKRDLYLIDHYLGKAAVQSLLPLRYNNTVLNLLLDPENIANIQVSALETTGVEERIGFYDKVGVIKDMVQSHLLQVLALLTMAMPVRQEVSSFRREKGDIISALRYDHEKKCGITLGQYEDYTSIDEIDDNSDTSTFVAFRCHIDLTKWYKVPIYVRTGKKLKHKHTYVVVEFKKPPIHENNPDIEPNRLIIELYPHEDIQIRLVNDMGHTTNAGRDLITEETLSCMGDDCLPAYGRLILDAFLGRYTSFLSIDEILASWHFVDDLMECVNKHDLPLVKYEGGGDGPKQQYELIQEDNIEWYDPDKL